MGRSADLETFSRRSCSMLTIYQRNASRYCDGVSRRSFLKVGAMGMAGLGLSDLLRLEASAGVTSSNKSLINIYLGGGPSHTDIFDLKPDAPSEFRGEFSPMATNVKGMEICELMPRLAKNADKFAVIRSIVGTYPDHSSVHTLTGYDDKDIKAVGGCPPLGSVVAKLQGGRNSAPPFVSLMGDVNAGFVGPVYQPFKPDGPGRANLQLSRIAERLCDRSKLLGDLDGIGRHIDWRDGRHGFLPAARSRLSPSGRLATALDLQKEDPAVLRPLPGRFTGSSRRHRQPPARPPTHRSRGAVTHARVLKRAFHGLFFWTWFLSGSLDGGGSPGGLFACAGPRRGPEQREGDERDPCRSHGSPFPRRARFETLLPPHVHAHCFRSAPGSTQQRRRPAPARRSRGVRRGTGRRRPARAPR